MPSLKSFIILGFSSAIVFSACSDKEASTSKSTPTPTSTASAETQPETKTTEPVAKTVADRGASLYKRCRICHTLNAGGANKAGPNLHGIFGAQAGTRPDFRYSKVMSESEIVWTDENLAAYIKNPMKFMPGNAMSFAGIRKDEDVALLLEYMREKTSE